MKPLLVILALCLAVVCYAEQACLVRITSKTLAMDISYNDDGSTTTNTSMRFVFETRGIAPQYRSAILVDTNEVSEVTSNSIASDVTAFYKLQGVAVNPTVTMP